MKIPVEWLEEAKVQSFRPARPGFRCEAEHEMVSLSDIEVPLRRTGYPLDVNGFKHERMVSILTAIRDDASLPAIRIEKADAGQRLYRVREGVHRYHASRTLGFTHVPSEVVERPDS